MTATQNTLRFCEIIKKRSEENKSAIDMLFVSKHYGQVMSILRQELDSMVRCIYLLNRTPQERERIIQQTLDGERWKSANGAIITDKSMVDIANNLSGWTNSVYKFGCAFIHLSNFHDYENYDIFQTIDAVERENIKQFMNGYYNYELNEELTFDTVKPYLFKVFMKIYDNLKCYITYLEHNRPLA